MGAPPPAPPPYPADALPRADDVAASQLPPQLSQEMCTQADKEARDQDVASHASDDSLDVREREGCLEPDVDDAEEPDEWDDAEGGDEDDQEPDGPDPTDSTTGGTASVKAQAHSSKTGPRRTDGTAAPSLFFLRCHCQ